MIRQPRSSYSLSKRSHCSVLAGAGGTLRLEHPAPRPLPRHAARIRAALPLGAHNLVSRQWRRLNTAGRNLRPVVAWFLWDIFRTAEYGAHTTRLLARLRMGPGQFRHFVALDRDALLAAGAVDVLRRPQGLVSGLRASTGNSSKIVCLVAGKRLADFDPSDGAIFADLPYQFACRASIFSATCSLDLARCFIDS
jgi:hypothetical protein